jgi:hypothetical protein
MTQTTTTTNTEIIPQRIEADHYQVPSFTTIDKIYNQKYDYDLKRWICDCPDTEKRHNINCKHVIILRTFIKREKAQQQPEKQHSTSVELVQVLTRIANLEAESTDLSKALYAQNELIGIKDQQIIILQEKLKSAEYQLSQHQQRIDDQRELIAALQTSVCKLNERTINHDTQINALAEQVSRPVEQVVRVVIEQQPAARATRQQSNEPAAMEIREIRNDKGKLAACKIGKFTVKVSGTCAGSCDCSTGLMDRRCPHIAKVDEYLSK